MTSAEASVAGQPDQRALPPLVPPTLTTLDRAVILLSSWQKGEVLSTKKKDELLGLIGALPDGAVTAQRWKSGLKALRAGYKP